MSRETQIEYFKSLAAFAHSIGLSVSLFNNRRNFDDLIDYADFAVGEDCDTTEDTCNYLRAVIAQGKPVFGVSYAENYPHIHEKF